MFEGRFNHFVCDECGERVQVTSFPDGWHWAPEGTGPVAHYCEICSEKVKATTKLFSRWQQGKVKV